MKISPADLGSGPKRKMERVEEGKDGSRTERERESVLSHAHGFSPTPSLRKGIRTV